MEISRSTGAGCKTEDLSEIFQRIRPSIEDFWPELFGKLTEPSIISISGASHSGKTTLLMEVVAKVLSQDDIEILFLDCDKNFNMYKLVDMCVKLMDVDQDNRETEIRKRLERLKIVTAFQDNFETTISKLPLILKKNNKISLILIDSLGAFYYLQKQTDPTSNIYISKEKFITAYLQKLQRVTAAFNVTVIYSTPEWNIKCSVNREITTTSFEMTRCTREVYSMKINSNNGNKTILFKINEEGIEFTPSQPMLRC